MLSPRAKLHCAEIALWVASGAAVLATLMLPGTGPWTLALFGVAVVLAILATRVGRKADRTFGWPMRTPLPDPACTCRHWFSEHLNQGLGCDLCSCSCFQFDSDKWRENQ